MTRNLTMMFVACGILSAAQPLIAETETVDGNTWTYSIHNDTATIYGTREIIDQDSWYPSFRYTPCTWAVGDVTIPASLGGKPVTRIGAYAFYNRSNLTSVTIPDGVTDISDNAFEYCSITNITIPASVTNIGNDAFRNCHIKSVHVADLEAWCKISFEFSDYVPMGPHDYYFGGHYSNPLSGADLYLNGSLITSLFIPESVTSIGADAFYNCKSLKEVYIPKKTRLGSNALTGSPAVIFRYDKFTRLMREQLTAEDGAETNIEFAVTNDCRVTFRWKCSCEPMRKGQMFDFLSFSIDGVQQAAICGETSWTNMQFTVTGKGEHVLRWSYQKDASGTEGEDCGWVCIANVAPPATLSFLPGEATAGKPPKAVSFYEDDDFVNLPGCGTLTYPKHSFAGWSDGETVQVAGWHYPCDSKVRTLTATWARNELQSAPVIDAPEEFRVGELATITITAEEGTSVHYTLDGSTPTATNTLYTSPFTIDATATIRAIAVRDDWFDSPEASVIVTKDPTTFGDAVNASLLEFTPNDGTGWRYVRGESPDGLALRSGAIGNSATSRVDTTVVGEGSISFSCKVAGEVVKDRVCDGLAFLVDGVQQGELMGNADWATNMFTIVGEGTHTLSWLYVKDATDEEGMDDDCAWLDEVVWLPSTPDPTPGSVIATNIVDVVVTNTVTRHVTVTNTIRIAAEAAIVPKAMRDAYPTTQFTGIDKVKMNGIVFDADGMMRGLIQVETAKATARGVRVKGFVMLEDGKKAAIKAVTVPIEGGRLAVETAVGKLGPLVLTIGGDGFKGSMGAMKVVSADVGADAGVLSGSLTLKHLDAAGKVKSQRVTVGGVVLGGTAAGTATPKGTPTKVFAAEVE